MRFLTWLVTNAVALAAALWLVDGIRITGAAQAPFGEEAKQKLLPLLVVALILGTVSAVIKPVLQLVSLPVIILTLGLFLLVINAAMLGITAWLYGLVLGGHVDHIFQVDGFWPAVWGGLIIAIVGAIVGHFLKDVDE